jgi:2-amino-4-hydroxy-6-hydroxymethyldihydropteridine diphosphokinase
MTMTQVFLGIGSNVNKEKNVHAGLNELRSRYDELQISPVYESKAFGFEGDDFYNLVVGFKTECAVEEIETQLKEIEYQFGRQRNVTRYSPRTLDIDLLLYGDLVSESHELPRVDIVKYAFVLKPLSDLAPDLVHPVNGETMIALWNKFDASNQTINQIKNPFG